ncbi:non-specific phospholipase C6 isoform X1 [Beta vulgaris subsp. vulgaris]|uniref:non-specific phospholipase C6 isoform X1 n=1 Tax=Beta vulgaris subsp. vulgaris TaxID=3555 RepID=UPI00053F7397|nr:non-specific phospholipase C6 isoform X1 [Beta vulgaris subsp. vulgaris]
MKTTFFLLLLLSFSSIFPPKQCLSQKQSPIKTIVVLVLENRSFDHLIGWMKKSINPKINGVDGTECNPVSTKDPRSKSVCVSNDAEYVDPDPGHSFEDVAKQVFGENNNISIPSMKGFIEQALSMSENVSAAVMKGFKPENVPVFEALVREFAVFDRWFSSIPGPTQPNRLFVYSGTSHGAVSHVKKQLALGYPQKTIFDSLHENKLDFGIYYQSIPSTLFYRNLRKLKYVFKFHLYDTFKKHAKAGKLPSLTVIEPRYFDIKGSPANDDHPSHDVANGQKLVKEVYETLRGSRQWNESLLVITYDEHGGFYDHVQTPYVNVPSPDGNTGPPPNFFKFDRLGVRVPTIMVSPWIKKGTVMSKAKGPTPDSEFEHSSIPATIKKIFNLKSNFLTHRDAWAGIFEDVVTQLTSPRTDCPEVLPEVTPLRKTEADEERQLSQFQTEVVQLAAVLNGDHFLSSFPNEMANKMNVREAHEYVTGAVSRFLRAGKEAVMLGADESTIVNMKSSLTTRSSTHH